MAALAVVEPRTAHDLAREALAEAGGNWDKASELLLRWLAEEPAARDELLRFAAQHFIRRMTHRQRSRIVAAVERCGGHPLQLPATHETTGLAALAVQNLLDYPLTGALKLRDAKRDDVLAAAQAQFTMGRRCHERGRWLSLVADKVPYGKRVGEVLSDGDLRALQQRAGEAGV